MEDGGRKQTPKPDALTLALASDPRFEKVEPSGKRFIVIGGQHRARRAHALLDKVARL